MKLSPQIPVAVFLTSFHPGGTERQMTELVRRLDRGRFDVHVACFRREGAWLSRIEGVAPISTFPIAGFARPATLAQAAVFARWCRRRQIAVLQTCDLYANTFALPAAALAGVPLRIASRRELAPDKSRGQIRLQRQAYRCAHAVVANSQAAASILRQEGVRETRIRVIANGVDLGRFPATSAPTRIRTFLTVANLRPEKAHETLLTAAALTAGAHPDWRFQIAGDGPRSTELQTLARDLGLGDRVQFLGHQEQIPALLAAADAFVLPSRSEAFPNGAIEAMAAGLPVVASRVGGLIDLIEDGRTGVLVPPDDPAALAAALTALAAAPARAAAIGAAARAAVSERYGFDRMVRAFEALYGSGLEAPAAPDGTRPLPSQAA